MIHVSPSRKGGATGDHLNRVCPRTSNREIFIAHFIGHLIENRPDFDEVGDEVASKEMAVTSSK